MSEWNSFLAELPPKGAKFIALFHDGSGACLYLRDEAGDFFGCEDFEIVDEEYLCSAFSLWMRVPSSYVFWAENGGKKVSDRALFEKHRCADNAGCNAATICVCAIAEDAFAEADALRADNARLREALQSAIGYMTNAAVDLGTSAPKRTALATIEGGIKLARAALASAPPAPAPGEKP